MMMMMVKCQCVWVISVVLFHDDDNDGYIITNVNLLGWHEHMLFQIFCSKP